MDINQRFVVLDSFRGLCAICVVFFHMNIVDSLTALSFFRNSHIFVEFFFILSGFVLAESYGFKKEVGFFKFIISRIFRIFPLHIFMLLFFIIFEICKLIAFKYYGFDFNIAPFTGSYAIAQIIPNFLLIQSWFYFFDATSFNYVSWSISVEFLLYLSFYFTLVFSKFNKFSIWLFVSLVMFYFLSNNNLILTNELQRGFAFFFLGACLNFLKHQIKFIKINKRLASILESVILILVLYFVAGDVDNDYLVAACLFSLTIIIFSFESGFFSSILTYPLLQLFGRLSYSIYMVHIAVLLIFLSFFMIIGKVTGTNFTPFLDGERYIDMGNVIFNNVLSITIFFIVICVSFFTNRFIEAPFVNLGRSLKKKTGP